MKEEGQTRILLKDLEGLTSNSFLLTPVAVFLASLLDGKRRLADVAYEFHTQTGITLKEDDIWAMVAQFAEAELLETPEVIAKRGGILKSYLDNPLRPMVHQGGGYPDTPANLEPFLNAFYKDAKGPKKSRPSPFALVTPHIDFHRGGPAYGCAYQALSECTPPDVILALGVAHQSPPTPWVFTDKAYDTPYGPVAVDRDLASALGEQLWYKPSQDEAVHRGEHSLEFQAVWLKHLWRDRCPPWVPVLCSSFSPLARDNLPSSILGLEEAFLKIGTVLAERFRQGERIMILAGIDLAHVGPRFGDQEILGPELEKRVEKEDRASMALALELKADDFYKSVMADGHWRKVCGLSALYSTLRWTRLMAGDTPVKGQLLTYGQAPDPLGGLVSFTSAIFR